MLRLFAITTLLLGPLNATDFFVAPNGSDKNPGTLKQPFFTIQRAQKEVSPGDTVYLRGGVYQMKEEHIARKERMWAYVTLLDKSGEAGKPISYRAAKGERPVFDFSAVKPSGLRVHAFQVSGSHLHLEGIEVTSIQVTAKGHTQSICFSNLGSNNIYERLSMHDGMGIGFYLSRGSNNLVLNCDAWNNDDPISSDGRGGNVDGFGFHPSRRNTGNIVRGCRAWFNSDDGFDCISAEESVRFENCWAFYNGFSPDFKSRADGNGFKAGGYGIGPESRFPRSVPRHVVTRCIAVRNKKNGFYANHHPGGGDWFHNTAFRNQTNYNMLCFDVETRRDIPGFDHVLKNNLGLESRNELVNIDPDSNILIGNAFGPKIGKRELLSIDESELTLPRQPNGELPVTSFLKLAPGSSLIDRGEDIGEPFAGKAPDPGAVEAL